MKSRRIKRKRYEEVAESLIAMIKTGELKPGDAGICGTVAKVLM